MDVSIVIPNYQGRELLPRTLAHLQKVLEACPLVVETIVVDDGSTDGSAEYVRTEQRWVKLVALERNGGFSGAVNAGGREAKAPFIYFMNSDVFPHEGFLEPLIECFRADPDLFAATSLNLNAEGRAIPPGQVSPVMKRGQIRVKGLELHELWSSGRLTDYGPIPTLFGAGGAVLTHAERFHALGGFAEIFRPFYYEDTDLGWRAWRRGWGSVLVTESLVLHDHKFSSIQSNHARRKVLTHKKRNRFLLVWRNYLDAGRLRRDHLVRLPLYLLGRLVTGDTVTLRGFREALRERRTVLEHRARERPAVRLTDQEIFDRLDQVRRELQGLVAGR